MAARLASVLLLVALAAGGAGAADRLVLGKSFTVKAASRRTVIGMGKELASDIASLSDPRAQGATLTVIANGGTTSSQTYALDAAGWKPLGSAGFKYAGPTGADGDPVKRVVMTRAPGGLVRIMILVQDGVGSQPVEVVPPNPGTDGGYILDVVGGDRYCVKLGGAAGGRVMRDDATAWRLTNAAAHDGCPVAQPVCGNGMVEPPETCDGTASTSECWQGNPTFNQCQDCQCCGIPEHRCSPQGTCCSPGDACAPATAALACTRTCTTSADCGGGGTTPAHCEDGFCCAALGEQCDNWTLGLHIRCCGGNACARGPDFYTQFTCCIPAGQACADGADCCSSSCNAGTSTCD